MTKSILKKWSALATLLLLIAFALPVQAQNVTVSPQTGKLIAAKTDGKELGFENGWSAMWRHEQLPLTLTVADEGDLTTGGELANPAGNLIEYQKNATVGNKLVFAGGSAKDGFMVLSLPKGYRITGYRLVLLNNLNSTTVSGISAGTQNKTFYETKSDFSYSSPLAQAPVMNGTSSDTREFVIERTSLSDDDMGNQLYFRLVHDHKAFYLVTIKSFEVFFTAEGTFEADVTPDVTGPARSLVMAPFKTSKIDIGDVTSQTKNGKTYFAYNYQNVSDLDAFTYLYQEDAIDNGTPSDVAEAKHITPVTVDGKNLYALGNDTYYIESPTQVFTQTGLSAPVGYRIVGALFNYLWGTETPSTSRTIPNACAITRTTTTTGWFGSTTTTTYYLNDQLTLTTTPFYWSVDEKGNIGYNGKYLSCEGSSNNYRTLTFSMNKDARWNLRRADNGNIYYESDGGSVYYLRYYNDYVGERPNRIRYELLLGRGTYDSSTNRLGSTVQAETTITTPGFSPGAYTLNVYDKTGKTIQKSIKVNSAADAGKVYDMGLCNNDAVKFSITDLEDGKQALVSVTLIMQALNPYIDKMDIVCHDNDDQLSLTQSFTADDFSVSGGIFKFYVPEEFKNSDLTFTFSDLYSKYGDETYYDGDGLGAARYAYVNSDYFTPINGDGNDGLYDSSYNPDADYKTKVYTSVAGNKAFKFNNAEDLGNTGSGVSYLEEYPFSVKTYKEDTGGQFVDVKLNATSKKSGTYYVFTADETRYNIAPSTAWQHRYYAFYTMQIELEAKTYTPDFQWTKIYDPASYNDNGAEASETMWGLKLGTVDSESLEGMEGYLTTKEIDDAITAALGKSERPTSADQILYVDGSELYSIINSSALTLEDLKAKLAPNSLFYLPANTTSTLDNFAYKTSSGSFRAGKDIVLKDKQPFYAPFDIQVDAANSAVYTREVSWSGDQYKKTAFQSVILPFNVDVASSGLTFRRMSNNALSDSEDPSTGTGSIVQATFTAISDAQTEANQPYMVQAQSVSGGDEVFTIKQTGATIKATTGMNTSDYTFEGDQVTATYGEASHSFQNTGTYSGKKFDVKADGNTYFYYASGYFRSSAELNRQYLYVYPFRAYYVYSATGGSKLTSFLASFDDSTISGIQDTNRKVDFAIHTGKGTLTVLSNSDKAVRINALNGMAVANVEAGSSQTINLPAGIYIVNGMKVIVK